MEKETILGFDVCTMKKQEILQKIFEDFNNKKQNIILNINPEIVVRNYRDLEWKKKFNSNMYQIPDGIGIVWASGKNNGKIKERITGIDFMLDICKKSQEYKGSIFLYGAKEEVIKKAKYELEQKHNILNIVGICNGYEKEEIVLKKIQESKADILFVGLGSPKQEEFIFANQGKLENVKIMFPVGGSFDVISQTIKRAPLIMQNLNLEWLYRLIRQPKRIFRQLSLIKFIILVRKEAKQNKKRGEEENG